MSYTDLRDALIGAVELYGATLRLVDGTWQWMDERWGGSHHIGFLTVTDREVQFIALAYAVSIGSDRIPTDAELAAAIDQHISTEGDRYDRAGMPWLRDVLADGQGDLIAMAVAAESEGKTAGEPEDMDGLTAVGTLAAHRRQRRHSRRGRCGNSEEGPS